MVKYVIFIIFIVSRILLLVFNKFQLQTKIIIHYSLNKKLKQIFIIFSFRKNKKITEKIMIEIDE